MVMDRSKLKSYCRFYCPLHDNWPQIEVFELDGDGIVTTCKDYEHGVCPAQKTDVNIYESPVDFLRCALVRDKKDVWTR